jgi:hypothetical protein
MIDGDKKADNSSILRFLGCAVLAASIIIAIICAVFASGDIGCSRCLCPAQTRSQTLTASSLITFEIPPNAGITKIYASFVQSEDSPIEGGEIMILSPSALEFNHWFGKDPLAAVGSFETTLVQPLCIGEEGATLFFSTIGQIEANVLNVTVVYCPDYCAE